MNLLSKDPMYEAFGQRALFQATYGGADFGECTTTIERISDGGLDEWHREWKATAERVAEIGDDSAAAGHPVSAREAYIRASTYYHTAYFPLFGKPVDPRLIEAFERETESFRKAAALFSPPIEVLESRSKTARSLPTSSRLTTLAPRGPLSSRRTATTRTSRRCTSLTRRLQSGADTTT